MILKKRGGVGDMNWNLFEFSKAINHFTQIHFSNTEYII